MTQSNPTTPLGATDTHMSVVHGAKMNPRNDHQKLENAASQRTGSTNHQMRMATRGPSSTSEVKKQHMTISLAFRIPTNATTPRQNPLADIGIHLPGDEGIRFGAP